jgi:peptidoglycan/xylan/chitin deacetylase (PgdA/CDA1 family)
MRAVLTYHSIEDSGSPISVTPDAFAHHVRWLASRRVRVVPLEDLVSVPVDQDAVAITFDDAFENFEAQAAPALLAHGWPVTLFVVTDRVGQTNAWNGRATPGIPTLPLLGWDSLGKLASAGINLGAHTRTHPDLTALPATMIADEIAGSASRLWDELRVKPLSFAYPYGHLNRVVAQRAASSFKWAVTTEFRPLENVEAPWLLPRLDMYYFQRAGSLDAWGTRGFAQRLSVRRRLRRLRSLVRPPVERTFAAWCRP